MSLDSIIFIKLTYQDNVYIYLYIII